MAFGQSWQSVSSGISIRQGEEREVNETRKGETERWHGEGLLPQSRDETKEAPSKLNPKTLSSCYVGRRRGGPADERRRGPHVGHWHEINPKRPVSEWKKKKLVFLKGGGRGRYLHELVQGCGDSA